MSIEETVRTAVASEDEAPGRNGLNPVETCPVCRKADPKPFLQAPDRFHGAPKQYRLVRCTACSLVWLEDPPRPDQIGEFYSPDYERLIGASGETSPERWTDRNATLAKYKRGGEVLDLGCSSGSFLNSLKGNSWKLHGIEMAPSAAKRAEARTGAKVFVGDVLAAPYKPDSFDLITCFDVLEHLYEPRQVIAKVHEWLKPGGIFYILVPNIDSAETRVFGSYAYGLELPRHLFHFSPESLRHLAQSVGLREVSLTTERNAAFEYCLRYIGDRLCQAVGYRRKPMAKAENPGLPWKIVRKGIRLTLLPLMVKLSALRGGGESIHAVFEKAPLGSGSGPNEKNAKPAEVKGRG